ncbi:uncharacterized protein LOC110053172 [Orbicella faveolata]|uniref:uncharacterized protein LOC110053172 n=1 Tax=Orbicella faveolata TaxID=48498 RepID=UPI0009E2AE4D|nr:uncharacterized protein LOC110053172 [Orbicella faveolata]
MQAIFLRIGRFGCGHGFKFIALFCVIFTFRMLYGSDTAAKENRLRNYAYVENFSPASSIPSITLFVRMAGKLQEHKTRFYCDIFRTAVLFWPASFGKTVVVFDGESDQDHIFANNLTSQIKQHFPDRKLEVAYEPLPKDESILISYAWFFERDRYDWNLKICSELKPYNRRLPVGHKITPEDTEDILSQPQTAFHVPYAKEPLSPNIFINYCLSHEATGNPQAMCSNSSVSRANNFVLFYHDLQRVTPGETPCTGNKKNHCLTVLDRHYKQVGVDIRKGRKIQWNDFETVKTLANEAGIICTKLVMNEGTKETPTN